LDLGAGRTGAAPGSAEPLGHALDRFCLGPPWWTVAARSSFSPAIMGLPPGGGVGTLGPRIV